MLILQGTLLKAINIAWNDYSTHIKRHRKDYERVDKILLIPNTLESFRVDIEEKPDVWRIGFFPSEQMVRDFNREFERIHPNTWSNMLNVYDITLVVRKADYKIIRWEHGV